MIVDIEEDLGIAPLANVFAEEYSAEEGEEEEEEEGEEEEEEEAGEGNEGASNRQPRTEGQQVRQQLMNHLLQHLNWYVQYGTSVVQFEHIQKI